MKIADARFTFWKIEPYKNTHKVTLSESNRLQNGEWESVNWWSFVMGSVAEKFYA